VIRSIERRSIVVYLRIFWLGSTAMKRSRLRIEMYGLFCATALLAGCGGNAVGLSGPSAQEASPSRFSPGASSFKSLVAFDGADGINPNAGLISVAGIFYGTTSFGGSSGCQSYETIPGCGTVYEMTTAGKETAIYSFKGSPGDGSFPHAPLTDVNGVLYGTTSKGGNGPCYSSSLQGGCGTVFKITTSGDETVLHNFTGGADGYSPSGAPLIYVQGALYGVTIFGGAHGAGTIFKITTSGKKSVLYSFKSNAPDSLPDGIVFVNGAFYGEASGAGSPYSTYGSIFKVTMSGKEARVYDFKGMPDGAQPENQLAAIGDTLYGTTLRGGDSGCSSSGCGTVFAVRMAGKERVLHSFEQNTKDGVEPYEGVIVVKGALYGVTCCGSGDSDGIVYKMTTAGHETILHTFTDPKEKDGWAPYANLMVTNTLLYGTTGWGGNTKPYKYGYGTIFRVAP
jgi:uncharacterized repeat protein (TIGR03803 family)